MDEKIQIECIGIVGVFGVVALLIKQYELAGICVAGILAFLSPKGVQTVQEATASNNAVTDTEQVVSDEQATPISTEDLAAQAVDNTASTTDTTQPVVASDVTPVQQVTLSQDSVNAIATALNQQNQPVQVQNIEQPQ